MAKFTYEPPKSVIDEMRKLGLNIGDIMGAMTRAGAETVRRNIVTNAPLTEIGEAARLSVTYRTPTDGGINTKVYFKGYKPFSGGRKYFTRRNRVGGKVYKTDKGVPISFLAQMYEYGRSDPTFPKKPFFRKSFKPAEIERVMIQTQKEESGGLL